ncbi:MAG TPA: hypothetical protein VEC36_07655, partial [Patescibacteria group bacterium]|nr:hypothetical protein [Patescibacteria group bacterium]
GVSRYSIAQLQVPFGTHVMKCPTPFGLYAYGFGFGEGAGGAAFDAYGNMGGQSFFELEDIPDIEPPLAEGRTTTTSFSAIFRDDRVNDRGMRSLEIVSNENMDVVIPVIEGGVPQITLPIRTAGGAQFGKIAIRATDVAGNSALYTICYSSDPRSGNAVYSLAPGDNAECGAPGSWWEAGAFLTASQIFHSADFSSSGNVSVPGVFGDAGGTGGYLGFMFGRRFSSDFGLNARLSFEDYNGQLKAVDTIQNTVRDPFTNETRVLQYERSLELDNLYMALSIAGEWNFHKNMYLLAGLKHNFTLGNGIMLQRRIIQPQGFTFENGAKEYTEPVDNLTSLNFFRLGVFGGLGFNYPVTLKINAFAEGVYTHHFGDIISDGSWRIRQLSFQLGARYKF